MSDAAYALLEALSQLIYELECLVSDCNADEMLAVRECCDELKTRMEQMLRLMASHHRMPGGDDGHDA